MITANCIRKSYGTQGAETVVLKNVSLERVKTTNMGSMFELTYLAEFIPGTNQKEFIDAVRCRNGNLTVYIARPVENREEI